MMGKYHDGVDLTVREIVFTVYSLPSVPSSQHSELLVRHSQGFHTSKRSILSFECPRILFK